MMHDVRGFSLAEIVVVVAIISLLGTVSVATYVSYRDQADFTATQSELWRLIETAKQQARTGLEDTSWSLELETDRVTLFAGVDFATRDQSFDQVHLLPSDTSLTGPPTLTFVPVTGYPNTVATYTLQSNDDNLNITINAYGTITTQ